MSAGASTLDMEKLRKVRALMLGGKTEGERRAATAKAETLAARAGLTLKAALSKLDMPAAPRPKSFFEDFGDWMEAKEPGWRAERAARRAEEDARRFARCRELRAVYGSEEAVFAPTDLEAALRDALAPFEDPKNTLWGYRGFTAGNPTPEMWAAMRGAVRVPETVPEAWAAYLEQERRNEDRCAFCPDYTPWQWEDAWRFAMERLLDTLRTPTAEGIAARLDWMDFLANREFSRDIERDEELLAALRDDFTTFAASVQSGQGTTAQRRAAVLDMLRASPSLSDREIARRVGCSPQTVGNLRRRKSA